MHYVGDAHYWALDEQFKVASLREVVDRHEENRTVGGVRFICNKYFCYINKPKKHSVQFMYEIDSLEAGMEWVVSQLVVQKLTN
jgi:hypothetical protein